MERWSTTRGLLLAALVLAAWTPAKAPLPRLFELRPWRVTGRRYGESDRGWETEWKTDTAHQIPYDDNTGLTAGKQYGGISTLIEEELKKYEAGVREAEDRLHLGFLEDIPLRTFNKPQDEKLEELHETKLEDLDDNKSDEGRSVSDRKPPEERHEEKLDDLDDNESDGYSSSNSVSTSDEEHHPHAPHAHKNSEESDRSSDEYVSTTKEPRMAKDILKGTVKDNRVEPSVTWWDSFANFRRLSLLHTLKNFN